MRRASEKKITWLSVKVLFGDILKRVFESLSSYRKFLLLIFSFLNFAIYTREAFPSFTFNSHNSTNVEIDKHFMIFKTGLDAKFVGANE